MKHVKFAAVYTKIIGIGWCTT